MRKAAFEIVRTARLLEVSRSGYYNWAKRQAAGPSQAQQRRASLTAKIIVSRRLNTELVVHTDSTVVAHRFALTWPGLLN